MATLNQLVAELANTQTFEAADRARKEVQYLGLRRGDQELQRELIAGYARCISDHARGEILWLLELNTHEHAEFVRLRKQLTEDKR